MGLLGRLRAPLGILLAPVVTRVAPEVCLFLGRPERERAEILFQPFGVNRKPSFRSFWLKGGLVGLTKATSRGCFQSLSAHSCRGPCVPC